MKPYKRLGELLIADEEDHLLRTIAPSEYLARASAQEVENASDEYLINTFQSELREVLHSFLNGGFSTLGYAAYPLVKGISKENKSRLAVISTMGKHLCERGFEVMSPKVGSSVECAKALASLYRDFDHMKKKGKLSTKGLCEQFHVNEYNQNDKAFLEPVVALQNASNKMRKSALGFYLHGSLATNDFVKGWSDCDTLCVVAKGAIQNPISLLRMREQMVGLRRFFYGVDPLQHHGSMVVSEYDLDCYPQAYFPLPLFTYAKSFWEDTITSIRTRDSKVESFAKLFWFVSYFRKMKMGRNCSWGSYKTKELLHMIALFPSLYLQVKGIVVYKKFSFGIARKEFSPELWKPIEEMTSIRSNWKPLPHFPLIESLARLNPIAAHHLNARLLDVYGSMHKTTIDIKNLVEGMHLLAEEAWMKARRSL
jgi:hypothetical protein